MLRYDKFYLFFYWFYFFLKSGIEEARIFICIYINNLRWRTSKRECRRVFLFFFIVNDSFFELKTFRLKFETKMHLQL